MSAVETLRVQIDNLWLELQRAQVENARLRDENASLRDERPEKAAELDATLEATLKAEQLKLENENLQTELQELRRDLHESREREARTVDGEHASSPGGSATASPRPPPKSVRFTSVDQPEQASPWGDEPEQTGIPYQSALSTALLAQQLPPIGKFSGESSLADGETFEAWRGQFEMVASVSHWDPQTKLVNLTT